MIRCTKNGGFGNLQLAGFHFLGIQIEGIADGKLGLFAVVPLLDGPQVAHDTGIYLGFQAAILAGLLLTDEITM